MAKVCSVPDPQNWEIPYDTKDYSKAFEKQDKLFDKLEKDPFAMYGEYMDKKTKGGVVGKLLRFGVGDGYAVYLVMKAKPLTVMHIPYSDAYMASGILLRGLRLSDIR